MENNNGQSDQQQNVDNFSNATANQTDTTGEDASLAGQEPEPVLDEEDMKENNLKEEDWENIVWNKPVQSNDDLSIATTEKDITD